MPSNIRSQQSSERFSENEYRVDPAVVKSCEHWWDGVKACYADLKEADNTETVLTHQRINDKSRTTFLNGESVLDCYEYERFYKRYRCFVSGE